jgi:hypothetical protein
LGRRPGAHRRRSVLVERAAKRGDRSAFGTRHFRSSFDTSNRRDVAVLEQRDPSPDRPGRLRRGDRDARERLAQAHPSPSVPPMPSPPPARRGQCLGDPRRSPRSGRAVRLVRVLERHEVLRLALGGSSARRTAPFEPSSPGDSMIFAP